MSKISDIVINALIKKGVLGTFRNFKTEVEIPADDGKQSIKVTITAENLEIKLDKGE